jgi:cytochrome c553
MNFRRTLRVLGLGLMAGVVATGLPRGARAEGDATHGKVQAYTCHGCHGIPDYRNAYPSYRVPKLGGQHAAFLQAALKEYSAQNRSHPTMYAQASTLSEQDIADIAVFFQGQSAAPTSAPAQVVGTPPAATQTCVACHGASGISPTPDYPTLAGQHADYLERALADYKNGKRKNPIMAGMVTALTDTDIKSVAEFYSQQRGLCSTEQIREHGKCR